MDVSAVDRAACHRRVMSTWEPFPPGSIGHAVVTEGCRFLIGSSATTSSHAIAISAVTLLPDETRTEPRWSIEMEFEFDDDVLVIEYPLALFWYYPLRNDAAAAVCEALRVVLVEEGYGNHWAHAAVEAVVHAIGRFHVEPGTIPDWITTPPARALLTGGESTLLAATTLATGRAELHLLSIAREQQSIQLELRLDTFDIDGRREDAREQLIYSGLIRWDSWLLPASRFDGPEFAALAALYRDDLAARIRRRGDLTDVTPNDLVIHPFFHTAQFWLSDGFPPPRPVVHAELEPSRLIACAKRAEVFAVLPFTVGKMELAYALGLRLNLEGSGWELVLGAGNDVEPDGAAVLLRRVGEERGAVLFRTDDEGQNRCVYTIDGDPATARRLSRWLGALLREASLDPILVAPDDDEEREVDGYDPYAACPAPTARELVAFHFEEHPFDWRLDRDRIVDCSAPYWNSDDSYLEPPSAEEVERVRREDVPTYYAFLREVLDPTFVGLLEKPQASG